MATRAFGVTEGRPLAAPGLAGVVRDLIAGAAPDWHDLALCPQTDPDAFFPERGGSTAAAKAICRLCPVEAECLADALDRDEGFGVWGGKSERERRRLKRRAT